MRSGGNIDRRRRALLRTSLAGIAGVALGGNWLLSRPVYAAWPANAFAAKTAEQALRELFGETAIEPSERVRIDLPALAENGAVVPLTVNADLPAIESISVVSEKNPVPLIARFDFGARAADGYLATRIKLAESEYVTVVVRSEGRLYSAQKFVEVTVGGCD
ncbi:MAG: thiosulfate oxidation carrier protein SoxY [Chromatiales bacterium]